MNFFVINRFIIAQNVPKVINIQSTPRRRIFNESNILAVLVADNPNLLEKLLSDERDHVSEVTITCDEYERIELVVEDNRHHFHDNGHIDFRLYGGVEWFCVEDARFTWALNLLAFTTPYINIHRVQPKSLIHLLSAVFPCIVWF